ncbi:MAG TPA: hypothetical protein VFW75_01095, partial [Acetobacteraceae bacterium]|nr:hypothetical protein [Acetobacteraceae bacterium]
RETRVMAFYTPLFRHRRKPDDRAPVSAARTETGAIIGEWSATKLGRILAGDGPDQQRSTSSVGAGGCPVPI